MKRILIFVLCLTAVLAVNLYFRSFTVNFPQLKTEPKLKGYFQDTAGQTYLLETDCWHWARYVENTLRLGHPGDRVINGRQIDELMLFPQGADLGRPLFLYYFSAWLYKIFSFFHPVPLYTFLFYLPLFFALIFIGALYIFCFLRWDNLAAVTACLFAGLAPAFLAHSSAGWFDRDILNLLFPLLIVWAYLSAQRSGTIRLKLCWIFCAAFLVGLFAYTWMFWWYIILVLIVYEFFSLLNILMAGGEEGAGRLFLFLRRLFFCCLFLIFTLFWIRFFLGSGELASLRHLLKESPSLNAPLANSAWPNAYFTVVEFQRPGILEIARQTGGPVLFTLCLVSLLGLFWRISRRGSGKDWQREHITLIVIWFILMYLACSKGVRFAAFLLLPLGMALGWGVSEAYRYFQARKNKLVTVTILAAALCLSGEFIYTARKNSAGLFPYMNDDWYGILNKIKDTTPPAAVINSWWDLGDWFKAVARRRVIFDGQSQNSPQSYWMARVLITENEEEAIRILRMLNNGANRAFEIINGQLNDFYQSIAILRKAILSTAVDAQAHLSKFLPQDKTRAVMELIFSAPKNKGYFIVDYSLPRKMEAISSLGNWDFADRMQDARMRLARGLKFYQGLLRGKEENGAVFFERGAVYLPAQQTARLFSLKDGIYKVPKSLFLFENNNFREISCPGNNLDFSALIFKRQGDYQALLLDTALARSLFVRLYYLNADGLKYFKPFLEASDEDNYIRVFEINWD